METTQEQTGCLVPGSCPIAPAPSVRKKMGEPDPHPERWGSCFSTETAVSLREPSRTKPVGGQGQKKNGQGIRYDSFAQ